MKILITRPERDAHELSDLLLDMKLVPVVCPLINITSKDFKISNPQNYQAILVTSSNSILSLKDSDQLSHLIDIPLFAVGDASMRAARRAGFKYVSSAEGDLEALRSLVLKKIDPQKGPLLYLSGEVISGDLKGILENHDYRVERVVLYGAEQLDSLPESVTAALEAGDIGAVVFYSKRTARIFMSLIEKAGIQLKVGLKVFCLSQAVAEVIMETSRAKASPEILNLEIAERPDQASMLELISNKI